MKQVLQPYNEAKDAAKFALVPELTHLHLAPGYVAILYPEDAHAPGMIWDVPGEVFKVVVKIRTDDAPSLAP
jgi:beta-galactosidase beta subunit